MGFEPIGEHAPETAQEVVESHGLRGPCPPYRECPECHTRSLTPWENPLLVLQRDVFGYKGEVTGGEVLCDECSTVACLDCYDAGWVALHVIENNQEVERLTRCHCWSSSHLPVVRGIPSEFRESTLGNYDHDGPRRKAIDTATGWLGAGAGDLYLFGGVGVGKTRLACSIANDILTTTDAAFVRVPDMIDRMRQLLTGNDPEEEAAYLKVYREVPVLVLDDVGAEKGSDYTRRVLQTLYDARLDQGRRTVWTSNLTLDELSEFLGDERLPSRIAGAALVVRVEGEDRRVNR